jgi:predicted DNA repair protein MutK
MTRRHHQLDDAGLHQSTHGDTALALMQRARAAPLRGCAVVDEGAVVAGTAAMFPVGGGIVVHVTRRIMPLSTTGGLTKCPQGDTLRLTLIA